MRTILRRTPAGAALVTALALGLAGCSNSTSPSTSGGPSLDQAQADSLGLFLTEDANELADAAVYTSSGLPISASVSAAPGIAALGGLSIQCRPTISPLPPVNSDSDAVPDSVRIDFSDCVISRPTRTVTMTGTIDKIDPTPTTTDFAIETVYDNFGKSVQDLVRKWSWGMTLDGTRTFTGTSSELTHTETDFRTTMTRGSDTSSMVKNGTSTFTADSAGTIRRDSLPSGMWNITGTAEWTRGTRSWSVVVHTDPDLHYNADCTTVPRFDSGSLIAVATRNDSTSTVTVTYTACGQYTVTKS